MNGQCWRKAAPPLPKNSELTLELPPSWPCRHTGSWSHGVEGQWLCPRTPPPHPHPSNLWPTSLEKAARIERGPRVISPGPSLGDGPLTLSAATSWGSSRGFSAPRGAPRGECCLGEDYGGERKQVPHHPSSSIPGAVGPSSRVQGQPGPPLPWAHPCEPGIELSEGPLVPFPGPVGDRSHTSQTNPPVQVPLHVSPPISPILQSHFLSPTPGFSFAFLIR